jgi:hypothetical protein
MRFSAVAAAVCLSLSPVMGGFADVPETAASATAASATAASANGIPAVAKPAPAAAPAGDAAAKHAKRTACLKDAKGKKLVGAEKTAFLKNCIATP